VTPRAAVLPAPPASNPQALDDAAVLEQDGGAVTAGNNSARVRWRHVDKLRPPARPSFWQWLFGHKETKKAKPGKPRH
jgi:hypothetical protein